jgi:hypothetical protein
MQMTNQLNAARQFMAGHARLLDRRRFELLFAGGDPERVLAALRAYRNPDGGYGHGLEPDLRAPESQPATALHAFEVFAEIAPVTAPEAVELCDWLDSNALPDGGLPFALPIEDASGSAPFWAQADPDAFSLQITAIVAANANRVAAHDPAVAAHPWLARATSRCLAAIDALEDAPEAYVLSFALRLLDAVHNREAAAPRLLARLGEYVPDDGRLRVAGGLPDEALWPLDLAPEPGRPGAGHPGRRDDRSRPGPARPRAAGGRRLVRRLSELLTGRSARVARLRDGARTFHPARERHHRYDGGTRRHQQLGRPHCTKSSARVA